MVGIILRVLSFLLFLFAALGAPRGTLHGYSELDVACFGLAAWVLATLVSGRAPGGPR